MSAFRRELDAAAPAMVAPGGGIEVWFTEPLGIYTKLRVTHFSTTESSFLAGEVTNRLRALGPPPYVFVHDWSGLLTYDSKARVAMTNWGFTLRKKMRCVRIFPGVDVPSLVRMGLTVGCSALTVAGYDVAPTADLGKTTRELGLRLRRAP